ncbi:S9 family peptidase [Streptomyces tsukubensis]|uniref:S9 family peptidase n=1 Tax=Streptomyces tsukubensis TaxID=83656 RepID=A0A1V4AAY5_9ACTN|nr:S9 family peptidase [Streptomyces tsukubensis]OON80599.1 S9 family peptidase [Streptomyces tsukubensis]QFR96253.1 prolyl oligopeptidase family serine peptidase [Streptomyces tsukubensis]
MAPRETISVEEFFGPPLRAKTTLSPDGRKMAYLALWENRLNVWIESVDTPGDSRCVTTEDRGVLSYHWTRDPRWLLYTRDQGGDENMHLYRVDLEDPDAAAVNLTPYPGVRTLGLDLPAGRPGKVITQLNLRDRAQFDLVELDIATGDLTTLAKNPGSEVEGWLYSERDLFAGGTTAEGDVLLSKWDAATGALDPVARFDGGDAPLGIYPLEVTPDGGGVWLGSYRGGDRLRLARLDLATGEEEEVDSHPRYDLDTRAQVFPALPSPLIRSRRTGELLGVRYLGERQVIHALDPHFAAVLKNLEKLSDGDLAGLSSDESGQRWVAGFTHDRDPGATFLYDHTTGESRLLHRARPHLDPESLAPMRPVEITSRDGLTLPSYLTLPVGIEPSRLPLVLFVHGGPWSRDSWGYHPAAQLFANRGYAVLQVNFRGSTGYGRAFTRAAIGEFAGKMHDDLIDGVRWAVERGYADPDRVAIMGGSYGGYASLAGVTFTPDVFAAAVDVVGISDLANFMRSQPDFVKPMLTHNWFTYVGDPADPEQEADMLARSPITRVDQIRTPLMVVHGANDARVVLAESDLLVEALRARGVPVEYTVMRDEGHAIENPENVIALYTGVERFLAEHLGFEARS